MSTTTSAAPDTIDGEALIAELASSTFGFDGLGPVRMGVPAGDLTAAGIALFDDDCGTLHKIQLAPSDFIDEVPLGIDPTTGRVMRVDLALLPDSVPDDDIAVTASILGVATLGDPVATAGAALEQAGAARVTVDGRAAWQLEDGATGRVIVVRAERGVLIQATVALDAAEARGAYCV